MRKLRTADLAYLLCFAWGAALAGEQSVEVFDEGTGMTAGALQEPLALVETGIYDVLDVSPKQPNVAYLGPVEWDRSGEPIYMLWLQLAPGVGGHRIDNLAIRGTVSLKIDNDFVSLEPTDLAKVRSGPYASKQPLGQAAYFGVDLVTLKRMASIAKVSLRLRASDLSMVDFLPSHETKTAMRKFLADRGLDH